MLLENVLFAVIFVFGFLILSYLPTKSKLWLIGLTSPFQIYVVSLAGFDPSLNLVFILSLWLIAIKSSQYVIRHVLVKILFGLLVFQILSLLWSSNFFLGIQTILSSLSFLFLLVASYRVEISQPGTINRILAFTLIMMIINSILVIAFRLNPSFEHAFLSSHFANKIIEPDTLSSLLSGVLKNNILDTEKSGGFFVNANVSSVYVGVGVFIAWGISGFRNLRWIRWVMVLLWSSIFFTGSKVALILGICFPVLAWLITLLAKYERQYWLLGLVVLSMIVMTSFVIVYGEFDSSMVNKLDNFIVALRSRMEIWSYAKQIFLETPFWGQGFGNWQKGFSSYAVIHNINEYFPPHNTIIALWSQSGLLVVFLGIWFMVETLKIAYHFHLLPNASFSMWGRMFGIASFWIFLQGFGENYGLFGDSHILVLFALGIGLSLAKLDLLKREKHVA